NPAASCALFCEEVGAMQPGHTNRQENQRDQQLRQPPQPPANQQRSATSDGPSMGLPALPGMPPGYSGIQPNQSPTAPARGPAMPMPARPDPAPARMPAQPRMPAGNAPAARPAPIPGGAYPAEMPAPITPAVAASLGRVSGLPAQPPTRPSQSAAGVSSESANAAGQRTPTLTQQMRSIQPPDVARQAMSELGVLARELATLPEELAAAGLSRTSATSYFEAAQIYLGLARQAWESVAEERLEQSGAEPEYRQRAIAVARRVTQLQQECRAINANTEFPLPRRTPLFWDRRVGLVRKGLLAFQDRLAPTPDPQEMGRGLFRLRGHIGLAGAAGLELGLLSVLTTGVLLLLSLLGIGVLAQLLGTGVSGGAALLCIVLLTVLVAALLVRGPHPLALLLGASVFSPAHTTRNGRSGAPLIAALLRSWWVLIGMVAVLGILSGLVYGGISATAQAQGQAPADLAGSLALVGGIVSMTILPAAAAGLACLLLLAIPTLIIALIRFGGEVAGSHGWVPTARRYALEPALAVLATATSLLVVGVWLAANAAGLEGVTLASFDFGTLPASVSLRGILLVLALALPYLLVLDLPYRLGMRRWRHAWMTDLTARRADVESHVRRLSVSDPQSGAQDTSEENLRAMQYDLVLLQFYRDKITEADRTSSEPFRLSSYLAALLITLIAAFLLDGLGASLAHLLLK
ncbi:MAG TPA: hypothetical protein VKQ30_21195, partial [Ktedonobacterales bacterium]|nr:hypothetical protein [Ktedonobacterales bacterium]